MVILSSSARFIASRVAATSCSAATRSTVVPRNASRLLGAPTCAGHRMISASRSLSTAAVIQEEDPFDGAEKDEAKLRYDLAVAHRAAADLGMDMLTWNHISGRFGKDNNNNNGCLITPGNMLWKHVKPQDLVVSSANITADIIHATLYEARPDVNAIMHVHTPAATAISCLQQGFVPLTQDAAYFYRKVATYNWDGVTNDGSEKEAMARAVASVPNSNTLLMKHHGFACFARSVPEVWVLAYYFERACDVQLRAMASGGTVLKPPAAVMEYAAKVSQEEFRPGAYEWEAICQGISFD